MERPHETEDPQRLARFVVPFGKYNGRQEPGATAMQFLLKDDRAPIAPSRPVALLPARLLCVAVVLTGG